MINVAKTSVNFEREPLLSPFGFKGGYVNEIWQLSVMMESSSQNKGNGLGVQSVLWSDSSVHTRFSQAGGNCMMFLITEYALKLVKERPFESPIELLDDIFPDVYEYGKSITGLIGLRKTFVLNALVGVDSAAWQLYAAEKGISSFDELIPKPLSSGLSHHHDKIAGIPLISYGTSVENVQALVDEGSFLLKIKVGSDPDKEGDPEKMLNWDKERLTQLHDILKDRKTPYTDDGNIPYYLDANGRYDSKDRLLRLLDHADRIGALGRIILFEEPFAEGSNIDVSDIPVRIAADESAHSQEDVIELIQLGYKAIALKPIAKTMSMSLKMADAAHKNNIPCFCADLTVNSLMVDWNKNVAARLAPIPGMKVGILESNGHQNYKNWDTMKTYHPCFGKDWIDPQNGLYVLSSEFYRLSGGILDTSPHYAALAES